MNCDRIRALLPAAAYGDLPPDECIQVNEHLASCTACQREQAGLRQVRQQLDSLPPPAVRIDIPRVLQAASHEQLRRGRRWMFAGAGIAAAILIGLVALKLEIRSDGHQLVIRWGTPPPLATPFEATPAPSERVVLASSAESEERFKLMNDLWNALARDAEDRDARHKAEIARLQARLNQWQAQSTQRMAATERDVAALYNVQFNPIAKGAEE
jgi:hypothetical protein